MNLDIWLPTAPARMPLTKSPVNTESALRMYASQTYISECLPEIRRPGSYQLAGRLVLTNALALHEPVNSRMVGPASSPNACAYYVSMTEHDSRWTQDEVRFTQTIESTEES